MSATAAALSKSWRVGRHTVTLTIPKPAVGEVRSAAFEWTPPKPSRMTPVEAEQYRAGRDAAVAELSRTLGLRVALVEV